MRTWHLNFVAMPLVVTVFVWVQYRVAALRDRLSPGPIVSGMVLPDEPRSYVFVFLAVVTMAIFGSLVELALFELVGLWFEVAILGTVFAGVVIVSEVQRRRKSTS